MDEAREVRQRELAQRVRAALFAASLEKVVTRSREAIGLGTDSALMGRRSTVAASRFRIARMRHWDAGVMRLAHEVAMMFERRGLYRTGD